MNILKALLFTLAASSALCSTAHSANDLEIMVFTSSEEHMGLGVNSALVMGEKDAVLIDAQFTLSNAHRLAAEILESGKNLTHIYVTHLHPDHFMGLPVLTQAFPNARVVSLAESADDINNAFDFKISYWGNEVLKQNGTKTKVFVESLDEPLIMLEGKRLEIVGPMQGDSANGTGVWIPSIKTLVASDLVFNRAHPWIADGKTPELRQAWLDALDQLAALKPEVVVPGHAPSNDLLDPQAIEFTAEYIRIFSEKLKSSENGDQIIAEMSALYPDASLMFALEYSARILRDDYKWEGEWPPELRATEVVR